MNNNKKNLFKSKVWHLFHGHETEKIESRFKIFYKHRSYSREDWLDHIRRNHEWGVPISDNIDLNGHKKWINESIMYSYLSTSKPIVTICMLSHLKYETLLDSLSKLASFGVAINLILWINESVTMSDKVRVKIHQICGSFTSYDVMSCDKDLGTSYPRYMMIHKAVHEYDTDYITMLDGNTSYDDPRTLFLGAVAMDVDGYQNYGAMGLWNNDETDAIKIQNNNITRTSTKPGRFYDVDILDTNTMTIRSSIMSTYNFDPKYVTGLEGWDISMQLNQHGYRLGLICEDEYTPNIKPNEDDLTISSNCKKRFGDKWKITIK